MSTFMDHLAGSRPDRHAVDEICKEVARNRNRDDYEIGQLLLLAEDIEVETLFGFTENTVFLDIHHVDPRSEGGTHEPARLVMLCEHHHRATHTCALLIDGTNGQGFTFRHADGTRYGSPEVGARISDLMTQAFETLTAMGYRHREARGILDGVRAQVCATSTLSEVVRAALKAAPAPMCVRESVAVYQRVA